MARPPPPRRGVGAKASRAQGRREARRQRGAAQGGRSVLEPAAAPTPGSARAPVTGARVPGRKRRLGSGVRRSPWSPPPARLRSLQPPPPPPPGVKQRARSQARGDSCGNSPGQGSSAAPSAPYLEGPAHAPPPRARPCARQCACVPRPLRRGRGRRGGGGASAGGWLRFRKARVLVLQPNEGWRCLAKVPANGRMQRPPSPLFMNLATFRMKILNTISAAGPLTTYILSKIASWSGNA